MHAETTVKRVNLCGEARRCKRSQSTNRLISHRKSEAQAWSDWKLPEYLIRARTCDLRIDYAVAFKQDMPAIDFSIEAAVCCICCTALVLRYLGGPLFA